MLIGRCVSALWVVLSLQFCSIAHAYCYIRTTDPESGTCPAVCAQTGRPLRWLTSELTYSLNDRGFPGLTQAEVSNIIASSFNTWAEVRCGEATTGLQFVELAQTSLRSLNPEGRAPTSNINAIAHLTREEWRENGYASQAYAITSVQFLESGELIGADMLFNGGLGQFADCPVEGCPRRSGLVDLRNVATHEAGHFLGMAHSDVADSTMWCGASPNEVQKRSLSSDDVTGLCSAYPPGGLFPRDPDPLAHGGSCHAAATTESLRPPALELLLPLVVVTAWRRRSTASRAHSILRKWLRV